MYKKSAIEIRDQFLRGEQSAVSIASYYLKRIAKYDPQIGAFLKVLDEKILQQAEQLDKKEQPICPSVNSPASRSRSRTISS